MFTRIPSGEYWHAQSACYTCGRVEDLIDTSVQIVGEGVLAICTNCVGEMALLGDKDEVEQMAALSGRLTAQLEDAQKLIRKLRKEIREERRAKAEANTPQQPSEGA